MQNTLTEIELDQLLAGYSPEELTAIKELALKEIAQGSDTPEAFFAWYELLFGNQCPKHLKRIIRHIWHAKSLDKGALIFAWRGSWKTTTVSIAFVAFRIGKDPHRANLIVQANDDSANKVTQAIRDIIVAHPAWKMVFPTIVPNEEEGWGVDGGYFVKDTSMSDGEWKKKTVARKDPTLLGLGIRSRSLIGKHPDGVLLMDDICDEENTKSDRENQNTINKVTGTILPFIVEDYSKPEGQRMITWNVAVGTPWRDDDPYHHLKDSGESLFINVPALWEVEEGTKGAVLLDDKMSGMYGWYGLTWPEQCPPDLIYTWRRRAGQREFARMYMLDLSKSKITGMRYQTYPAELINPVIWETAAGVDFASIRTQDADTRDRDFFAMAYIAKLPTGGAVIFGGVFGHYTIAQGEQFIKRIQQTLPNFGYTYVEETGKGEIFVDMLVRNPTLRVIPTKLSQRDKKTRQEREMAPWMEIGVVKISDADDPFLNLLRRSLEDYPDGNDDVRDAALLSMKSMPEVLVVPDTQDGQALPQVQAQRNKQKKTNPFNALGG